MCMFMYACLGERRVKERENLKKRMEKKEGENEWAKDP